ncbi:fascin domain-containing protein [Actinosynnema sp. CS-041913]|uniref:fascin domain-containing protein n=1 Tax=Actinosynnema sp. CS-041913 TaxID=3239917 RepID=UPI003D92D3B5
MAFVATFAVVQPSASAETRASWEVVTGGEVSALATNFYSAASKRYVSAEMGYQGGDHAMLRARADKVGPWEQFSLYYSDGAKAWAIRSNHNDLYVSAELGYGGGDYGMLRARAKAIGPWEKYDLLYNSAEKRHALRSQANDRYVSVEMGYQGGDHAMLRARATELGPWEKFII